MEAVLNRKLYYASLPEVLKQLFLRDRHNLVVTGTHGKTTTTALLTWIMTVAKLEPGYVIGGIPKNLGQGALLNDSKYFVIEGDEYDSAFFDKRSKFVHYLPELLIVNNIEFDHADIFNNLDEIKLSFRRLLNIVPQNGMILLNGDDPNCVEVAQQLQPLLAPLEEVGFSPNCARQIREGLVFRDRLVVLPSARTSSRSRSSASSTCATRPWRYRPRVSTACRSIRSARRSRASRGSRGGRKCAGKRAAIKVIDDFGASSHSDPRNVTRVTPSLSRLAHLGHLRAALEHHPARGFPADLAGCAQAGRRRFHFPGGAPGANPRKRAARSQSRGGINRRCRPAGVL